ncbi:hypothetical protein BVRB_028990, partial [Beta vulgaris subsp. vulgaris]
AGLLSVAVYVSYNMRLVVDAFEIKNELITMGGTLLIGAFPFWFIAVLFPSLEQTRCFIIMSGCHCMNPYHGADLMLSQAAIIGESVRPSCYSCQPGKTSYDALQRYETELRHVDADGGCRVDLDSKRRRLSGFARARSRRRLQKQNSGPA